MVINFWHLLPQMVVETESFQDLDKFLCSRSIKWIKFLLSDVLSSILKSVVVESEGHRQWLALCYPQTIHPIATAGERHGIIYTTALTMNDICYI